MLEGKNIQETCNATLLVISVSLLIIQDNLLLYLEHFGEVSRIEAPPPHRRAMMHIDVL